MTYEIINGECQETMRGMDENSVDAIVCDPPYALAFMGNEWDSYGSSGGNESEGERREKSHDYASKNPGAPRYGNSHGHAPRRDENVAFQEHMTPIFAEALRVAKPGAHLLAFGSPRTFHRLFCAIEDAGWVVKDCVSWVYGCLDEETEVLIDGEFVPYNKVKIGSFALGYDIERRTFSWQRIEDTYLYDYDDTAYAIQSDSTDQLVSRNHRCIIERGGVEQFALAEQVALEREASVPVLEGLHGLLDRLPLSDERTGSTQQDMLEGVCCGDSADTAEEAQGSRTERDVRYMRQDVLHATSVDTEGERTALLKEMQWQGACGGVAGVQKGAPREAEENRGTITELARENDGREESIVEGRRHVSPSQGQLRECEVRSMSQGVRVDGSKGWIRDGASTGRGEGDRQAAYTDGMRASHQSRPARQQTREPDAVSEQSGAQALRSTWGAKTTLARVTPVHYEGKMWCIKVATGAFVARRHGKIFITGNSGFPKGMNVSKAIDNDDAERWQGWNTQIKPAWEPICLAYKPLDGTVAQNVTKWGVGALNIDACRVPTFSEGPGTTPKSSVDGRRNSMAGAMDRVAYDGSKGRFPANFVHDGSDEVRECFPDASGQQGDLRAGISRQKGVCYGDLPSTDERVRRVDSDKSAARFFYCAKASRSDRGSFNTHSTVKPTALMQWLVRLVCPKDGVVLDPFCGSGSTGVACMREQMRFVGIDQEPEYCEIAERRIREECERGVQLNLF